MDLLREVLYALLGLVMNLCLQSPFLSEVRQSFLPGSPARAIARTALAFTE